MMGRMQLVGSMLIIIIYCIQEIQISIKQLILCQVIPYYIQLKYMFQNSYQNGHYFEIFDPKASQDKVKNLYKLMNITGNNKIFDKQLKTFVFEFNNANSKIVFPKQDRKQLYLIQQFLNLQILFCQGMSWSIELYISDLNKIKRRVILSPTSKLETKTFFVKFPCSHVQEGIWNNLTIDLYSFINAFKGQTYRSLDMIIISGFFKLRRIYTTQQPPVTFPHDNQQSKSINLLPKAIFMPPQVQCSNCMIAYQSTSIVNQQLMMEDLTQPSTQNKSNNFSRNQISTPKTEVMRPEKKGYKNEKKFLADTNGPQKKRKKIQNDTSGQTDKSRYTQKVVSVQKKQKKRNVGKSEVPKYRTSIQKKKGVKQQQKLKVKSKLNPWRSSKKNQTQTDGSQLSQTKPKQQRKTESAETTLFKTKNKLVSKFSESGNKAFEHRSDHYSDSQYVQLSQKFSTVTEGKFFKNQLNTHNAQMVQKQPDQIEQHIELQSNQMCESVNRKAKQQQIIKQLKNQAIDESISDSLDNLNKDKNGNKLNNNSMINNNMMTSYYGFGQNLMKKYMNQVQRPYSPPLCEKQLTQQLVSERNEACQQNDKQVQVIYDPILNCYYDHKTHTYYQLKN